MTCSLCDKPTGFKVLLRPDGLGDDPKEQLLSSSRVFLPRVDDCVDQYEHTTLGYQMAVDFCQDCLRIIEDHLRRGITTARILALRERQQQ